MFFLLCLRCGEDDVSIVLGIVGSVLGCGAAYIMPGYLRLAHMRQRKKAGLMNSMTDVVINHVLVAAGVLFGVLGVIITLTTPGHGDHH